MCFENVSSFPLILYMLLSDSSCQVFSYLFFLALEKLSLVVAA